MYITRGFSPHILCVLLLCPWASDSSALTIGFYGEISDIELATWPPYCRANVSSRYRSIRETGLVSETEEQKWKRYLGPIHDSIHHYCQGLLWKFRANRPSWLARNSLKRDGVLTQAVAEMHYTWSRILPTHPLYAKMGATILSAHQEAGDPDAAQGVIKELFKYKNQDRRTYIGAADFYRNQDELSRAIEILELGAKKVKRNGGILADLAQDYYDIKQYEKSREYARLARSKGRKLVKLGRKLEEAGYPITKK